MNAKHSRELNGYRMEVFTFCGKYTAMLTNITTGAMLRNDGWSDYSSALDYVQRMYRSRLI